MNNTRTLSLTLAMFLTFVAAPARTAEPPAHFDPKGRPPSTFTLELRNGLKATLPFSDKRDFDEAARGVLAAPPDQQKPVDREVVLASGRSL